MSRSQTACCRLLHDIKVSSFSLLCFPSVPHWRSEGAVWECGGDRWHSHAAGFPAPTAGGDTPPGGEAQVQQRAGEQELPHPRSACQAQLHRLAGRWETNVKSILTYFWRDKYTQCWIFTQRASMNMVKNTVLTSQFEDRLDCWVFQTLGWYNSSSMEACFYSVVSKLLVLGPILSLGKTPEQFY